MTITFLSVFPDYFSSVLKESILKRASEKNIVTFEILDIRSFTEDKHRQTDDRPFGGGAGMVMKVEPIDAALQHWHAQHPEGKKIVIATSAAGSRFTQSKAEDLSKINHIAIICGHYEGIDQRVLDNLVDVELRIGDYVLTGGEPAAVVIADAVARLVPGVLGNEVSLQNESHAAQGQGNFPQYTRPTVYKNWPVPEILLSGNHKEIDNWREINRKEIKD